MNCLKTDFGGENFSLLHPLTLHQKATQWSVSEVSKGKNELVSELCNGVHMQPRETIVAAAHFAICVFS